MAQDGRHIDIGDTELYVVERGHGYPVMILHGGPGLDHHSFGGYLSPLEDRHRLIYVDLRSQGLSERTPPETWTLQQMAQDIHSLSAALNLEKFAVFGHSYGSFVTQQYGVDYPGEADRLIIAGAVPSSHYLMPHVEKSLAEFEPESLRSQWLLQEPEGDRAFLQHTGCEARLSGPVHDRGRRAGTGLLARAGGCTECEHQGAG